MDLFLYTERITELHMITIEAQHNLPEEQKVKEIVEMLLEKYKVPIFTSKVIISKGEVPHSHPVLTLNTRSLDPLVIFQVFIHEQMHWFATNHSEYKNAIKVLKENFKDNGECNKSGEHPNSFWEHIIVCFNTRKILTEILDEPQVVHIYNQWQAYPLTEKLVENEYYRIEEILNKFEIILEYIP